MVNLRHLAKRIAGRIRAEGILGLLTAVWERIFEFNSATWYACETGREQEILENSCKPSFDLVRLLDMEDWFLSLSHEFSYAWNQREMECARDHDHLGVAVKVDSDTAGYIKIAMKSVFIADFAERIAIPDGLAFIYDSFIHPVHRGKRLAESAIRFAINQTHQRGCQTIACHIPDWNIASINSYTRAGFKPKGKIWYVRFLGLRIYSSRPEKLLVNINGGH